MPMDDYDEATDSRLLCDLHRAQVRLNSKRMSGFYFLTWVQTAALPSSAAAVAHRDRAVPPRSALAGRRGRCGALVPSVRAEMQPVCFLQPSDTPEFTPEHIFTCVIRFPVHQSPIAPHKLKKNNETSCHN